MIQSQFVYNILDLLLDEDEGENEIKARLQLEYLTENHYEYTGVGVFIGFVYDEGIEKHKVTEDKLILSGVEIKSDELEIGADVHLFFTNGIIDFMEICSYDGVYPKSELKTYSLEQIWEGSSRKKITRN
ncbi:hypothetical protein ACE193_10800 [Bernardetia sp. OM2101]|uniref:hypothetical protein n=1 Tax=Bernardetia sp. OM2101 TaxID=3344876 RepID=UPI0035D126ED